MKTINNKKRKAYLNIILWTLFIIGSSTMVGILFQGFELFSSFPYYIKYTSFGWAIGFTFWLGHGLIGYYTEKKLDWTKNLKKANVISLLMYIIYGIVACPILSYGFNFFTLEMTGQDLFINTLLMALMMFSLDMIAISVFYSTYLTKFWISNGYTKTLCFDQSI